MKKQIINILKRLEQENFINLIMPYSDIEAFLENKILENKIISTH